MVNTCAALQLIEPGSPNGRCSSTFLRLLRIQVETPPDTVIGVLQTIFDAGAIPIGSIRRKSVIAISYRVTTRWQPKSNASFSSSQRYFLSHLPLRISSSKRARGSSKWVHPIFWADRSATIPPIKKFSPTIIFDAAFEGGHSGGPAFDQRRLSLLTPKNGTHPLQVADFRECGYCPANFRIQIGRGTTPICA